MPGELVGRNGGLITAFLASLPSPLSPRAEGTMGEYISCDELLSDPRTQATQPRPLVNRVSSYDMDAHYRFGGVIPTLRPAQQTELHKELLKFITAQGTPGVMPSEPKLQAAGRSDIVTAISRLGGWHKVAAELGLQMAYSLREVYFTCPPTLSAGQEIEFRMPGMPQRFAANIPVGVKPGDEFIVRVPPVLPSATHGLVRLMDPDSARQKLLQLSEEMEQMSLMQQEIAMIKTALRQQDAQLSSLRDRNQQLAAAKEAEVTRQAELAALVQAAKEEFPLISY